MDLSNPNANPNPNPNPNPNVDLSGAKASIIAMANNTLPLAQLLAGLFAGAFIQQFVTTSGPGSDSLGQAGAEQRAVRYLFIWGGVGVGGLEVFLLVLMQCVRKGP